MIYISHRGNLNGPNIETENTRNQILQCIDLGYSVEVDIWFENDSYFLGHDEPKEKISKNFLDHYANYIWCHAKSSEALFNLIKDNLHCFWHEEDRYTLTSKGVIWAYPNSILNKNSVCVLPEKQSINLPEQIFGICSDYIDFYRTTLEIFKDWT